MAFKQSKVTFQSCETCIYHRRLDSYIINICHNIDPTSFEQQSRVLDTKSASFNCTVENLAVDMQMASTKLGSSRPS